MGWKNKIVWHEGLFLQPHHLQQQERFLEAYVQGRSRATHPYPWGLAELSLDTDQLRVGKLVIQSGAGIFPDGTPFSFPDEHPSPPPIDLNPGTQDFRIYLGVPLRRPGASEIDLVESSQSSTRYRLQEGKINDVVTDPKNEIDVQLGALNLQLLPPDRPRDDFSCLGIVHVLECQADSQVKLNTEYIPPVLDIQAAPPLIGFVQELAGLMNHRGNLLAERLEGTEEHSANLTELLQLCQINRSEPVVTHLAQLADLHPETLYRILIALAGEFSTFSKESRRIESFPPYRHDELGASFKPVFTALRKAFGMIIERRAIKIPLEEPRFGIRKAPLEDHGLLTNADFYLAVKANMPLEDLRGTFVTQSKLGSVEAIRDLVISSVPGITLLLQPVKPPGVTAGYQLYFKLDAQSDLWPPAEKSGGFAIHVADAFPGLKMEFWAVRRGAG